MKKIGTFSVLMLLFVSLFAGGPEKELDSLLPQDSPAVTEDATLPLTLEEGNLQLIKQSMKTKEMEKSRFRVARQVIRSEYLLTQQVMEIMALFEYDNTRLHFAKEAYSSVVDPDNYDILADEFMYAANQEKLDDFLVRYDSTMRLPRISAADSVTFTYTLRKMVSSASDKSRLQIAKGAVANDYLDCVQVAQMIETFDTDESKVTFATYAYSHVIDPYNFSGMDFLYDHKTNYELVENYIKRH